MEEGKKMVHFGRTLSRTAKCILTLERTRLAKQQSCAALVYVLVVCVLVDGSSWARRGWKTNIPNMSEQMSE